MPSNCSSCRALIDGGDVLYTATGAVVCASCFAKADLAVSVERAKLGPTGLAGAGAVAGAIPFFVSFTISHDGVSRDWIAVSCGAIALVCGLIPAIGALRTGSARSTVLICAAVAALGALQIARGFGLL